MNEQLEQLADLRGQLHEANEELRRAAAPLDRLPNLTGEEWDAVAEQLRAGQTRWDDITGRISRVLRVLNPGGR